MSTEVEFDKRLVEEARHKLHAIIRVRGKDYDPEDPDVEAALVALQGAQEVLEASERRAALAAVERTAVEKAVLTEAEQVEVAKSRIAVAKATNRMSKYTKKLERGVEILQEAFDGLTRISAEAYGALHKSDQDKAIRNTYFEFSGKLTYALLLTLAAHGIPAVPDNSVTRKHRETRTLDSAVEAFVSAVRRND